jgi:outer membrane protein TolC
LWPALARGQPEPPGTDEPVFRLPADYRLEDLPPSERIDVGDGPALTLGQVLSSVRRHHPTVQAARQSLAATRGERLAAEGGFDLQLEARGWMAPGGFYQWGRADVALVQPTPLWGTTFYGGWRIGRPFESNEELDPGIPPYYRNYETLTGGEVRVGLTVPLWRDGPIDERRADLWRAQHAVDASARELDTSLLSMRLDAATAYWSWVAAGQKYRVAARVLDLAERRDAQIRARVAAGAIAPIEALENRRVILRRRRALIAARRALERAAIALSLYLRDRGGDPLVPPPERVPLDPPSPPPLRVDLERAIRAALRRHPTLARFDALIERQRVSVELAENRFAPQIDVGVEASLDLGTGNARQQVTYEDPVLEGSVLLTFPFQFRQARGTIRETRGELARLGEEARLARDRVATSVRDALSAVRAAEEGVDMARQAAEVAEAVAEGERRRFELGATELLIVNLREQAAAQARAELADAEAALRVARAQWRAATAIGFAPRE